ncbi:potassium channel family protein [Ktedonosporobacter rubrisoli]|nr:potassium channel protein [Ktedonosporobacter rubrisoli]
MKPPASYRHLIIASLLVASVLIAGTIGYMFIEQLSFVDALYTTVGMMSTVGNVIHPITPLGRIFTIFVIVFGVGSLLYTFGAGMEFMIEGHFSQAVRRHHMDNKIAALRNHAIICGFGRVGSQIAQDLAAARQTFVVLDENEQNIRACLEAGYLALQGDATSDDLLHKAGIQSAQCVLVATDNDAHNISITLSARHLNKQLHIVARANHNETEAKLKLAGADRVLSPYVIGGHRMANLAFQPIVTDFIDKITKADSIDLAVQEVGLSAHSSLVGKTMEEAQDMLPNGIVVVALKKANGMISGPGLQTCIEAGDTAILVGMPGPLAAFKVKHG